MWPSFVAFKEYKVKIFLWGEKVKIPSFFFWFCFFFLNIILMKLDIITYMFKDHLWLQWDHIHPLPTHLNLNTSMRRYISNSTNRQHFKSIDIWNIKLSWLTINLYWDLPVHWKWLSFNKNVSEITHLYTPPPKKKILIDYVC